MIIVDAHEDLAWNALTFNRDYLRSVNETRQIERSTDIAAWNGTTMLGWPEWLDGRVAMIFGTLFASPERWRKGSWETLCYRDEDQAFALYNNQWSYYQRFFDDHPDRFKPIRDRSTLDELLAVWKQGRVEPSPIGVVLLMEGADAVRDERDLHDWYRKGVRVISLSWARTRYAGGTGEPGGLTSAGHTLMSEMEKLGLILDLSHLSEDGALEAIDRYTGELVITHTAPLDLGVDVLRPERFVTTRVMRGVAERDSVLGLVLANHFLRQDWKLPMERELVSLDDVAIRIDSICQLLGSARHVGIGSDFDGGFGLEKVPGGLDSVADLRLIGEALARRGYTESDIEAILNGNWLRILQRALPEHQTV